MQKTLDQETIKKINEALFDRRHPVELKIENGQVVVVELIRKVISKENPIEE